MNGGFSNHNNTGHFEDILLKNYQDWLPLVAIAFEHGVPEAHQTINDYLQGLHKTSSDVFEYWDQLRIKYKEQLNKWKAKAAVKFIVTKLVQRLIARFGHKLAMEILLKTASHPVGYVADGAQILLEIFGYEMAGKLVGAAGNALGGVLAGYTVGGPPGAFLGGAMGLGIWGIGEYVHYEYIEQLKSFVDKVLT